MTQFLLLKTGEAMGEGGGEKTILFGKIHDGCRDDDGAIEQSDVACKYFSIYVLVFVQLPG